MKNKKIRKIVNEAIGFIHLMSDDTVSQKEGKKVIKRLRKVKFCNLHFVSNMSLSDQQIEEHIWGYFPEGLNNSDMENETDAYKRYLEIVEIVKDMRNIP